MYYYSYVISEVSVVFGQMICQYNTVIGIDVQSCNEGKLSYYQRLGKWKRGKGGKAEWPLALDR